MSKLVKATEGLSVSKPILTSHTCDKVKDREGEVKIGVRRGASTRMGKFPDALSIEKMLGHQERSNQTAI
jgi:hypothetical protein